MKAAVFLFSFLSFSSSAQDIYACTGVNRLCRFDPAQCAFEELFPIELLDIAVEGNYLYGCSSSYGLLRIDPYTGETETLPAGAFGSGLVGDGNGNLYAGSSQIVRYNLASGTAELVGDLYDYDYLTEGDMEFRGDRLYVAAMHMSGTSYVLEVGLSPFSVTPIIEIPNGCFGMTGGNLPENQLYLNIGYDVYILDVLTAELSFLCEGAYFAYGFAYAPENLLPLGTDELAAAGATVSQQIETGAVTIVLPANTTEESYRLFNTAGQVVKEGKLVENRTSLDLAGFSAGMYQLEIGKGLHVSHHRVIVFD